MKAEGFANATEMELRQKANECFDKLESRGSAEKPALLIEAQFYMDEIERREQDRIASRGYRLEKIVLGLEVIVVILIGLELIDGGRQFKRQTCSPKWTRRNSHTNEFSAESAGRVR